MSKLPSSYKVVKTVCCKSCPNVYALVQQDEDTKYYCTFNQPKRPKNGDYFDINERFIDPKNDEEWEKLGDQIEEWHNWIDGIEVDGTYGICDNYF